MTNFVTLTVDMKKLAKSRCDLTAELHKVNILAQKLTDISTKGPFHEGLSQTSQQFYGPETRGKYLGEPVPMAVSG